MTFTEALAEVYPPIEVMGVSICPIAALKAQDPQAYAILENEWHKHDFSPVLKLVSNE